VSRSPEWLYELLPAFVRVADYYQGEPLRTLMSVLEMEYQAVESDLDQLYENWFVETCEEWVLPYLGDLLGLRGLSGARPEVFSLRGRVGNAIAERRRKGTILGLAAAVRDGTGWAPHVVRYRDRVARSWSVEDGGAGGQAAARNLDLRRMPIARPAAPALDGPFWGAARTASVSGTAPEAAALTGGSPRPGRFTSVTLGIYLWRLQLYPVHRGAARRLPSPGARFTASPFGIDQPLFWMRPASATDDGAGGEAAGAGEGTAGEAAAGAPGGVWSDGAGVPEPLGRAQLAAALARAARRDEMSSGSGGSGGLVGAGEPSAEEPPLRVFVSPGAGEPFVEVPPAAMVAADLGGWLPPPGGARLAVDPERGRLLFAGDRPAREVRVSFAYGASGDLGGGSYPRRSSGPLDTGRGRWEGVVSRDAPPEAIPAAGPFTRPGEELIELYRSLEQALAAWIEAVATRPPGPGETIDARVRILDSAIYDVGALPLSLPPGCRRLVIEAGAGACPCLVGDLSLRAMAGADDERPDVVLSGLWIDGRVLAGGPLRLTVDHCTLKPPPAAPEAETAPQAETAPEAEAGAASPGSLAALDGAGVRRLEVIVQSSVLGPIRLPVECVGIEIADSIVDGGAGGQALSGPAAVLARCTFFGAVAVARLQAASCLFTARVEAADTDPSSGWVRFSYLPPGSSTPPCESCQPPPGRAPARGGDVRPSFTSRRYGDPGYAQLARHVPAAIAAGGEDGSEMGAFHGLYQPQRQGNLPTVIEEFVPWGCEAFVELMT
jgi:hypothetical protein